MKTDSLIENSLINDTDYCAAFHTACDIIMELGQRLEILEAKELLHGFLSDLTSGLMDQAHVLAIARGQIIGKEKQARRNKECERLKKELAVAEATLTVPAIPYRG